MKRLYRCLFITSLTILFSACSLAPTYQRPELSIPPHYKESNKWIPANPTYSEKQRGPWWEIYHDPILNDLENRVTLANQNLKSALARYQEARAVLTVTKSAYFPTSNGIGNYAREQISGNVANKDKLSLFNDYLLGANISYEVDVWGRVRNAVANSRYLAQASAADLATISLSLHADLASSYFSIRETDAALKVVDAVVKAYEKALFLVRKRHQGGIAPEADVDEAVFQLQNAKTVAADIRLRRSQLEHAIAILVGEAPASFSLKPLRMNVKFISVAKTLPSSLLERRPDIASAERQVQAANANIGVARAAFFPQINLAGQLGFESALLGNLISAPSLFWSIGPVAASSLMPPIATVNIFDGGRLRGLLDQAKASYYETVANYRQTVLTALQEVEDNIAAMRQYEKEYHTQHAATLAAERALKQAMYRYKGGIITYLDVVIIQNQALQSELSLIDIRTKRHLASVQLIKALGGGWSTVDLPTI